MRTRLEITGVGDLDMYSDMSLPITYSISDIKEPDTRKASFSKSILLPGTKNNNRLFGQIFEIDSYSSFNPNLKTDVILYVDGLENLSGVLRLASITRRGDNLEYSVTIIGSIGNIFTAVGQSFLTDLDFSAHDHVLNVDNITASWTPTIGEGYVYPMVDYGYNNGIDWNITDLYPALFLKQYIDKIFAASGYTYTSAFFETDLFKSLIIPYPGGTLRLTESDIDNNAMSVQQNSTQLILANTWTAITFPTTVNDPSGSWSSFGWTAKISADFQFQFIASIPILSSARLDYRILYFNPGSTVPVVLKQVNNQEGYWRGATAEIGTRWFAPVRVNKGGIVIFQIKPRTNLTLEAGGYAGARVSNGDVLEGETVTMAGAIPPKIKQADLLKSVIKMFNLYVNPDPSLRNNLLIEPRDDFYSDGVVIDWTSKLDKGKGLVIKPVGDINANKYIYTYKSDSDHYNKDYSGMFGEVYGTRTIETVNDFVKGTKKTEVIFSATPLIQDDANGRTISVMSQTQLGILTDSKPVNNIRLLYWGGLISSGTVWNIVKDIRGSSFTATSITKYPQSSYPYAGHLDNPYTPTFDLSFGVPKQVYFDTLTYTNATLFNKYHKQFIEDLIDSDSRSVEGYFYLKAIDINKLDFRNEFYVDGHKLILLQAENYDAVIPGTTKCTFLKVRAKPSATVTDTSSSGGIDVVVLGSSLYQRPA